MQSGWFTRLCFYSQPYLNHPGLYSRPALTPPPLRLPLPPAFSFLSHFVVRVNIRSSTSPGILRFHRLPVGSRSYLTASFSDVVTLRASMNVTRYCLEIDPTPLFKQRKRWTSQVVKIRGPSMTFCWELNLETHEVD